MSVFLLLLSTVWVNLELWAGWETKHLVSYLHVNSSYVRSILSTLIIAVWPRTREIFPSNDAGFVCGLIPVHDCAMTRSWCYPQAYLVYHPTLRLKMAPESKGYEDLSCIVLNQLKLPLLGSGGSHHPTLSRCPSLCSWDRVAEIREYSVRWARRDRYWGETWRNGTLDRFEIQQHVFCE